MGGDTPRARAGTLREGLGLPPARRQAATAARRFTCRHTTPGKWLRFQVEDEEGTRTLSFDDLNGWFEERFRRARAGKPELLQIQLVRRSLGWGCEFPDYYVGTDPNMEQGTPCVDPEPERLLPKATRSGWTRIVEGYFTGVVRPWRPEDPPEDEEENCGQPLHEFRVLRVLDLEPPEGLLARIVGTCRPVDGNEEPRATRRTTSRRHPLPAHQH